MTDSSPSTTERTLHLVELLIRKPDGYSPQELTRLLGISRSSLFQLLRTLKTLGYVEQSGRRGLYRPGQRLLTWLDRLRSLAPAPLTQDLLTAFHQEAGRRAWPETLLLAGRSDAAESHWRVIGQVEGHEQVRSVYTPGQECAGDNDAAAQVLRLPPPGEVRQNGYALTHREPLIELALPVCPDGIRPEAALVLSAPAFRWDGNALLDAWLPDLRRLAARLSYRLGAAAYTPYSPERGSDIGPAAALEPAELHAFLQNPITARLACIRPDGRPHVVPVWQEWDGRHFTVIAWRGSQWSEYLLQNEDVSLTIDEPWPPLRRVTARGRAEPLPYKPGEAQLTDLLKRLSARYLGEASPTSLSGQVERAFRITPESLTGWQGFPVSAAGAN